MRLYIVQYQTTVLYCLESGLSMAKVLCILAALAATADGANVVSIQRWGC
jgi:hypothetical protein